MQQFGAQPLNIGEQVRLRSREYPHAVSELEWYEIIRVDDHSLDAVRIVGGLPFGQVRYGVGHNQILDWLPARSFETMFL